MVAVVSAAAALAAGAEASAAAALREAGDAEPARPSAHCRHHRGRGTENRRRDLLRAGARGVELPRGAAGFRGVLRLAAAAAAGLGGAAPLGPGRHLFKLER